MTARPFEVRVRQQQPRVAVVELHGEINGTAEATLNAAYAEATSQGSVTILLNFADVDYINSTGIALIVGLLGQARSTHLNLIACGLSEHYIEIFRITRLADFLSVFPDEASALKQAGG
ncbi:MAG TPA: STAS domain-containing protein [Ktedonobacterales bacterium]|nr:STAS domain-containing protein [Ktedonobacterales bacterium]